MSIHNIFSSSKPQYIHYPIARQVLKGVLKDNNVLKDRNSDTYKLLNQFVATDLNKSDKSSKFHVGILKIKNLILSAFDCCTKQKAKRNTALDIIDECVQEILKPKNPSNNLSHRSTKVALKALNIASTSSHSDEDSKVSKKESSSTDESETNQNSTSLEFSQSDETSETDENNSISKKTARSSETDEKDSTSKVKPKERDLSSLMTTSVQKGEYFSFPNQQKVDKILENPAFQAFINQGQEDPFRKQLCEEISYSYPRCQVEHLDEPVIFIPDANAIEEQALYYYKKYGIIIRMANDNTAVKVVEELNNKITSPMYVGMVVSSVDINDPSNHANHIVPIVLFFPGNHIKADIQLVSLDSIAHAGPFRSYFPILEVNKMLKGKNTYFACSPRQADTYSCHTDAIVVLRNALLSLKYHGCKNGFKEAFKVKGLNLSISSYGNEISSLPPEWDYTSQITNPLVKASQSDQSTVRSNYSKKSKTPMTVKEHRQKNSSPQRIKFTISSTTKPKFITDSPPEGVTFESSECGWECSFIVERQMNTYLVRKGRKIKSKKAKLEKN